MPDPQFADAALDPDVIPAVYNGCDQWCDYCPLTTRCLAFRCRPPRSGAGADVYQDIAEAMRETLDRLKAAPAETGAPTAVRWLAAHEPPAETVPPQADDPLEGMGRRYVRLAAAYLATRDDLTLEIPKRPSGPTPLDVVVRYHMLIGAKIDRAIVSGAAAARTGGEGAAWDARISAKVALLLAERSDEALSLLALDEADARIAHLRAHLRRLVREVEVRFPGARSVVRPGFE